jgi:hypothetical protein
MDLLGLAPAGFSTAPDNSPRAMAEVVHIGNALAEKRVTRLRWSIEPAESDGGRNLRGGKVTTQVPEGLPCATHVSVALEPPPSRKLPALLAFRLRVVPRILQAGWPPSDRNLSMGQPPRKWRLIGIDLG